MATEQWEPTMSVGDGIMFCGQHAKHAAVPGIIEVVDVTREKPYGVRLCNGNFYWAAGTQLITSAIREEIKGGEI